MKFAADPFFLGKEHFGFSSVSGGISHPDLKHVPPVIAICCYHVPCCFCPLRTAHQTYHKITVPLHATALL